MMTSIIVTMTIYDNYYCDHDNPRQLYLWWWKSMTRSLQRWQWEEGMMMIDDNYLCDHDNQWQTQDWGGLVDIVLRGEAALLENKKSGEKHDNETSYKLFKITVTSYLECMDLFEAWKYQRQHSWCKAFTDDKELQEFLNNSVAFKTKIENIQKGDMISYFSVLRIVMRFEEQNWNNLFLISGCWRLTQGSSSQPWPVCSKQPVQILGLGHHIESNYPYYHPHAHHNHYWARPPSWERFPGESSALLEILQLAWLSCKRLFYLTTWLLWGLFVSSL